jgi:hypothetical protein
MPACMSSFVIPLGGRFLAAGLSIINSFNAYPKVCALPPLPPLDYFGAIFFVVEPSALLQWQCGRQRGPRSIHYPAGNGVGTNPQSSTRGRHVDLTAH